MRKRLLALMLALALTVSSALPAFAEDPAVEAGEPTAVSDTDTTDAEPQPEVIETEDEGEVPVVDPVEEAAPDFVAEPEEDPVEEPAPAEEPAEEEPAPVEEPAEEPAPVEEPAVVMNSAPVERNAELNFTLSTPETPSSSKVTEGLFGAGTVDAIKANIAGSKVSFASGAEGAYTVTVAADRADLKTSTPTDPTKSDSSKLTEGLWVPVLLSFKAGGAEATANVTGAGLTAKDASAYLDTPAEGQTKVLVKMLNILAMPEAADTFSFFGAEIKVNYVYDDTAELKVEALRPTTSETALAPIDQAEKESVHKNLDAINSFEFDAATNTVDIEVDLTKMVRYKAAKFGNTQAAWFPIALHFTDEHDAGSTGANEVSDNISVVGAPGETDEKLEDQKAKGFVAAAPHYGLTGNQKAVIKWVGLVNANAQTYTTTYRNTASGAEVVLTVNVAVKENTANPALALKSATKATKADSVSGDTTKKTSEWDAGLEQNLKAVRYVGYDEKTNTVTVKADLDRMKKYVASESDYKESAKWIPVLMDFVNTNANSVSVNESVHYEDGKALDTSKTSVFADVKENDPDPVVAVEWLALDTMVTSGATATYWMYSTPTATGETAAPLVRKAINFKVEDTSKLTLTVGKVSPFYTGLKDVLQNTIADPEGGEEYALVKQNLQAVKSIVPVDGGYKITVDIDKMAQYKSNADVSKTAPPDKAAWFPVLFTFTDVDGKTVTPDVTVYEPDDAGATLKPNADVNDTLKDAENYGAAVDTSYVAWFGTKALNEEGKKFTIYYKTKDATTGANVAQSCKVTLVTTGKAPAMNATARKVDPEKINEDQFLKDEDKLLEGEYEKVYKNASHVTSVDSYAEKIDGEDHVVVTVYAELRGMEAYAAKDNLSWTTTPYKYVPVLVNMTDNNGAAAIPSDLKQQNEDSVKYGGTPANGDVIIYVPLDKNGVNTAVPGGKVYNKTSMTLEPTTTTPETILDFICVDASAEAALTVAVDVPEVKAGQLSDTVNIGTSDITITKSLHDLVAQNLGAVELKYVASATGSNDKLSVTADLAKMVKFKKDSAAESVAAYWVPIVITLTNEYGEPVAPKEAPTADPANFTVNEAALGSNSYIYWLDLENVPGDITVAPNSEADGAAHTVKLSVSTGNAPALTVTGKALTVNDIDFNVLKANIPAITGNITKIDEVTTSVVASKTDPNDKTTVITVKGNFADSEYTAYAGKYDGTTEDKVKWVPVVLAFADGANEQVKAGDMHAATGNTLFTGSNTFAKSGVVQWVKVETGKSFGSTDVMTFADGNGNTVKAQIVLSPTDSALSAQMKLAPGVKDDNNNVTFPSLQKKTVQAPDPTTPETLISQTEEVVLKRNLEHITVSGPMSVDENTTGYTLTVDDMSKLITYEASGKNKPSGKYAWIPVLFSFYEGTNAKLISAEALLAGETDSSTRIKVDNGKMNFDGDVAEDNANINGVADFGGTSGQWLEWVGIDPTNVNGSYNLTWQFDDTTTGAQHFVSVDIVKVPTKDLSARSVTVELDKSSVEYNKTKQLPKVTVKDGGVEVSNSKYTVSYQLNGVDITNEEDVKNAGTYTVVVTGNGTSEYNGTSKSTTYTITPKPLTLDMVGTIADTQIKPDTRTAEPVIEVTDDGTKLNATGSVDEAGNKLPSDYYVTVTNNTKVGTANVTVTGLNNYTGSVKTTFKVTNFEFKPEDIIVNITSETYTGKNLSPTLEVIYHDNDDPDDKPITLHKGTDYNVHFVNNVSANVNLDGEKLHEADPQPKAVIEFKGLFEGAANLEREFAIYPIELKASIANLSAKTNRDGTYKALKPTVKFTNARTGKKVTLKNTTKKKYYSIEYTNLFTNKTGGEEIVTSPATYTAAFTMIDTNYGLVDEDYAATDDVNFVVGADLKTATIKLYNTKNIVYDPDDEEVTFDENLGGEASTTDPYYQIYVKVGDTIEYLEEGRDYEVDYENNFKAGKATIIFTALQNDEAYAQNNVQRLFYGTVKKTFTIKPCDLSTLEHDKLTINVPEVIYTGNKVTPMPTVKVGTAKNIELKAKDGKVKNDFSVTYKNNVNAGDQAVVTVKGSGNYKGSAQQTFTIKQLNLSQDVEIVIADTPINANKNKIKPKVTVYLKNDAEDAEHGDVVKSGVYTVDYNTFDRSDDVWTYGGEANDKDLTITAKKPDNFTGDPYKGIGSVTFKLGVPMNKVTVKGVKTMTYDPMSFETDGVVLPELVLTYKVNGQVYTLKEGYDFTVDYKDNDGKGKASVILTGVSDTAEEGKPYFMGDVTKKFSIKARNMKTANKNGEIVLGYANGKGGVTELASSVAFENAPITFDDMQVFDKGIELEKDVDYTVTYKNNTKISKGKSKASIVVKGIGNYTGSFTQQFTITP